jgi:hypothetical protein
MCLLCTGSQQRSALKDTFFMNYDPTTTQKRSNDVRFRPTTIPDEVGEIMPIRLRDHANDNFGALRDAVRENSAWITPLQQEMSRVIVGQTQLLDRLLVARACRGSRKRWR